MTCVGASRLLSPYLDGALTGKQMQSLGKHLEGCARCRQEYESLRLTQQLVTGLRQKKAPADMDLRLRVAISREAAAAERPPLQGFRIRMENALNAFMVPATAGLVAAILVFGLLVSGFTLPPALQASYESQDVPLLLYTDPELQVSAFGVTSLPTIKGDSLVIEAYVDANGRVQDYRILSDPDDTRELLSEVKNMLIFTTFRPAMTMGRPTAGRAVLSFSKINVKG